jgi:hypothetical protein
MGAHAVRAVMASRLPTHPRGLLSLAVTDNPAGIIKHTLSNTQRLLLGVFSIPRPPRQSIFSTGLNLSIDR